MENGQVFRVHGWIMLKGLDMGLHKVLSQDEFSYTFAKPNGNKATCRHYKSSVDAKIVCFERGDLNGIELIN